MNTMRHLVMVSMLLFVGDAAAQTFPQDAAWSPLPCGNGVMTDGYRDQPGAFAERDLVGVDAAPAGYRAFDASFLYLRMRLDQDPAPAGTPRPFSWGFEFDLDGVPSTYELLIALNGTPAQIAVYRNTTTTLPNDPADPADLPALATFPFATHGRSVVAGGTMNGNDPDYFLDLAIPWSALSSVGFTAATTLRVWAASSSNDNFLNGDFACHDGAGAAPMLTVIPTRLIAVDPAVVPSVPDAGVDAGGGPRVIEGGPGCSLSGPGSSLRSAGATGASLLAALLLLGSLLGWAIVSVQPLRPKGKRRHD